MVKYIILLVFCVLLSPLTFADNKIAPVTLSFNFHKVETKEALKIIADAANMQLKLVSPIKGKISLFIKDSSLKETIAKISHLANLKIQLQDKWIFVQQDLKLKAKSKKHLTPSLQIRKVKLQHSNAHSVVEQITKKSKSNKIGAVGSGILANYNTNELLIWGSEARVRTLLANIRFLDKINKSIEISATIFIANKSTAQSLGVRWGGRIKSGKWQLTGGKAGSVPSETFVSLGNAPIIDFNPSNKAFGVAALGFGKGDSMLDVELSVLDTQGTVKILSKPKITTINGKTAVISSGTEIPYQVTSKDSVTVSFRKALLELSVTPYAINKNKLLLDIKISSDTVGTIYQGMPSIDVNNISTSVALLNKETMVIGGIIKNIKQETESKIPFLGDLPLIGFLFRYKETFQQNWELMIAITPIIHQ